MTFSDATTIERERVFGRPITVPQTTQQTTADSAKIIENKINQETDKLRSRVADLVRLRADADQPNYARLKSEIADLRKCLELLKDGGAMIAAALFEAD
jgi:hypothetical protein